MPGAENVDNEDEYSTAITDARGVYDELCPEDQLWYFEDEINPWLAAAAERKSLSADRTNGINASIGDVSGKTEENPTRQVDGDKK